MQEEPDLKAGIAEKNRQIKYKINAGRKVLSLIKNTVVLKFTRRNAIMETIEKEKNYTQKVIIPNNIFKRP